MMPETFPFTVYSRRRKTLLYLVGSAALAAVAILMACDGKPIGWAIAAFFGLCTAVFAIQLHPRASFLTVDADGFEYSALFRRHRLRWADVTEFGVITLSHHGIKTHTMVGLNYSESYPHHQRGRSLSRAMTGFEGALPDTYGFSAEELAALLSACHAKLTATDAETVAAPQESTWDEPQSGDGV